MNDSTLAKMKHMDDLIAKGIAFQIALKTIGQPIGPAKVEAVMAMNGPEERKTGMYRILVDMAMQTDPNKRAVPVKIPWVFHVDDVAVIMEPPLNAEGDKLVVVPGGNGKITPGGIHIG